MASSMRKEESLKPGNSPYKDSFEMKIDMNFYPKSRQKAVKIEIFPSYFLQNDW